ncbi:MAG: TRAP transporter large permease [Rhodospirillaceae bacterium]|nr:TRAP transporter large permease [Rhodospirillaceae bacterium]
MDWQFLLLLLTGTALGLMLIGLPVMTAFFVTNILGAFLFMGGSRGVVQMIGNGAESVANFSLAPVPLFLFMGTLFFRSGLAKRVLDALDRCFGALPGRLAYVTVVASTVFAALSGSSIANTGMMGSIMVPEMVRRGYKPHLAIGPIIGAGGLAVIIPPSSLTVFLGSIARVDIAALLLAGLVPGLLIALAYVILIVFQVRVDPAAAPRYAVERTPLSRILLLLAADVMPMGLIVFTVVGTMILGIATPTEAAALGCVAVMVLAAAYRVFDWRKIAHALEDAFRVSAMSFILIVAASTFAQTVAFSGASGAFVQWSAGLHLGPLATILFMFAVLLVLGCFIDSLSMMLLTMPLYLPLAQAMGMDLIWFCTLMLIALEIGFATPPFGMLLFVMMGVVPGTTLGQVSRAAIPYVACQMLVVALLVAFPGLVLFLPRLLQ